MYRVIIIEDDPMVRALHIDYVQKNKQFKVESVFKNGREAMDFFANGGETDLIILDYFMPIMDGGQFLHNLCKSGKSIPVIMITSLDDVSLIQDFWGLGVIDYLLKPFAYDRFSHAMDKFLKMNEIKKSGRRITQEELDLFFCMGEEHQEKRLDKGMQPKTLETLVEFLKEHPDEVLTAKKIADELLLSKVTVRRYMGYLVKEGFCENQIDYATGGRPSICYICRKGVFDSWKIQ